MNADVIKLVDAFRYLGNLHDVIILSVVWAQGDKRIELFVDDFNTNFESLPEYEGEKPGKIILLDVYRVCFDIDVCDDNLNIYDLSVSEVGGRYCVSILLWPNGRMTIYCGGIETSPILA
jgi:hypothetical protein